MGYANAVRTSSTCRRRSTYGTSILKQGTEKVDMMYPADLHPLPVASTWHIKRFHSKYSTVLALKLIGPCIAIVTTFSDRVRLPTRGHDDRCMMISLVSPLHPSVRKCLRKISEIEYLRVNWMRRYWIFFTSQRQSVLIWDKNH